MAVRGKIVQHAMPLSSGTRFGPYEITAPLGAGGMGEVYRARDSKLGRDHEIELTRFEPPGRFCRKELQGSEISISIL
jgi:serine/threonine protein kinase